MRRDQSARSELEREIFGAVSSVLAQPSAASSLQAVDRLLGTAQETPKSLAAQMRAAKTWKDARDVLSRVAKQGAAGDQADAALLTATFTVLPKRESTQGAQVTRQSQPRQNRRHAVQLQARCTPPAQRESTSSIGRVS